MTELLAREKEKNFLCAEVYPGKGNGGEADFAASAAHLSVDERNVSIKKWWDSFEWEKFAASKSLLHFRPTVILAADPSLVYSILETVRLQRDSGAQNVPLTAAEFENMVAQVLTRNFGAARKIAARALGNPELDTMLAQCRIRDFTVGKRAVVNPVGTLGRRIEAKFEMSFTTRPIFETWKNFFNSPEGFYFTDMSRARIWALERLSKIPFSILSLNPHGTHLVVAGPPGAAKLQREHFLWSSNQFSASLAKAWGVSANSASKIYEKYAQGGVSETAAGKIGAFIEPAVAALLAKIQKSKVKGKVYVHSNIPLPPLMPKKIRRSPLSDPPLENLLSELGFTLGAPSGVPVSRQFDFMAYFLEFYYDKDDSVINRWLRRRVHWLSP